MAWLRQRRTDDELEKVVSMERWVRLLCHDFTLMGSVDDKDMEELCKIAKEVREAYEANETE